jgi:penicillin-insensitive murein endopeptidase
MATFCRLSHLLALVAASAVLSLATPAGAKDSKKAAAARTTETRDRSGRGRASSTGAPNHGQLEGGIQVRKSAHLAVREDAHPWGLPALVKLLHRAADDVAAKHKGAVLFVADLSAKSGGPLAGHRSHQSGRDADVGFYVTNSKGKAVNAKRFIGFNGDGRARDVEWARFDDARNWALVEALLKNENVRYVFVSTSLRARLLKFGAKKRASEAIMQRAAAVMVVPGEHVDVHDDHFHVRISCPESSSKCVEESIGQAGPDDIYEESAKPSSPPPPEPQ